jgi:hypothetical protein
LTWERWFDFRKEEDRAIFNLQQDFSNNRYLRDLSAAVLRGKKEAAAAGYFTGGSVPYGFDRLLIDAKGNIVKRVVRGEKLGYRERGWHVALVPIPEDDPDAARQLERQTAIWLYTTYDAQNVSYRWLAGQLNAREVPSPAGGKWSVQAVTKILTNTAYGGERLLKVALIGSGVALAGGLLWRGLRKGRGGREGAIVGSGFQRDLRQASYSRSTSARLHRGR